MKHVDFSTLTNRVITEIKGCTKYSERIVITCNDGAEFEMTHLQSCCECVQVEDIEGDLTDIVGYVVTNAEEVCHDGSNLTTDDVLYSDAESYTWTFYKLDTRRGGITIRWLGTSNGYYSESVDFLQTQHGLMDI